MIQPLRTNHRRIFLGLAVLVPAVFVAGLLARPKPAPERAGAMLVAITSQTWKNHLFILQVSQGTGAGDTAQILPAKVTLAPDLLVYYCDNSPQDSLPANAHLLGRWDAGASYPLPSSSTGFLVVYSAAQKSVADFVSLGGRP